MVGTAGSTERNVPSFHYPYGSQAVHDVTLEDVPAIGLVAAHDSHCGWGVGRRSRGSDVAYSVHNELRCKVAFALR